MYFNTPVLEAQTFRPIFTALDDSGTDWSAGCLLPSLFTNLSIWSVEREDQGLG